MLQVTRYHMLVATFIMFEQEVSEEVRKEILGLIVDRFFEMEVIGKIEPL